MLHAVVEFGAAVYGNARSAGGLDGGDQFHSVPLHSLDSSKAMFAPDECAGLAWPLPSPITLVSTLDSLQVDATMSKATKEKLRWCTNLGLKEYFKGVTPRDFHEIFVVGHVADPRALATA